MNKWKGRVSLLSLAAILWWVPAHSEPIRGATVSDWWEQNLVEVVKSRLGPAGARIFPVWSREGGEPSFDGVLLAAPSELDLGIVVSCELRIYFDPSDLRPNAIIFNIEDSLSLTRVETYFGVPAELRSCRPAEVPIPEDAPLVPALEGGGTLMLAVFRGPRVVAEMAGDAQSITTLRWVGPEHELEGCP